MSCVSHNNATGSIEEGTAATAAAAATTTTGCTRTQTKVAIVFLFIGVLVALELLTEWNSLGSLLPTSSYQISEHPPQQSMSLRSDESLHYLPLLPWEEKSLSTKRVCRPPKGTPDYCCIGSLSEGGQVGFARDKCNVGPDVYKHAEEIALTTLADYPLTTKEATTSAQQHCDWCHIVEILMEKNWTLAFQGDSLTRQTFAGVECELRRRDLYQVTLIQIFEQKDTKPRWRYGLDQIFELHVSHKDSNRNTSISSSNVAVIRYYAMYRPHEYMADVKDVMRNNDILVFDHGLHYGQFEDNGELFLTEMTKLINTLFTGKNSRLKILAWRETTAQHYDTPGGHYLPDANFTYCAPMKPEHRNSADWRRPIIEQIVNSTGIEYPQQLDILPFYKYTSYLHDLHHGADCSHFCSTPSLWLPLWRVLRLAIDRALVDATGTGDDVRKYFLI
jgi:hypothetical protein